MRFSPTTEAPRPANASQLPAETMVSPIQADRAEKNLIETEPEEAIPWLIVAERSAAATGDLALLNLLWTEESRVIDRRGSEDATHAYVWDGKAAVLNRYVVAVFPHAPPPLAPDALGAIQIIPDGDAMVVENENDRWRFIKQSGRWWIAELSYTSK